MADEKAPQILMTSDELARKELAAAVKEMRENPINVTEPGGKYVRADGQLQDAEGNIIDPKRAKPGSSEDAAAAVAELKEKLAQAERDFARAQATAAAAPPDEPKKGKGK